MARRYVIQVRRAPVVEAGSWEDVADAGTAGEADDEVASWASPRLSHGDVVRVLSPSGSERSIGAWDADSSGVSIDPTRPRGGSLSWLWDESDDAGEMLGACWGVSRLRVAAASIGVAAYAQDLDRSRSGQRPSHLLRQAEAVLYEGANASRKKETPRQSALEASALRMAEASRDGGRHAARAAVLACAVVLDATGAHRLGTSVRRSLGYVVQDTIGTAAACLWWAVRAQALTIGDREHAAASCALAVRKAVPLSSVVCGHLGLRDPLPPPSRPPEERRGNPGGGSFRGARRGPVAEAAAAMELGKRLPTARYVHVSLYPELPPAVRGAVDRASSLAGVGIGHVQLLKIGTVDESVSLLRYPGFWDEPFPALAESWSVDLASGRVRHASYSQGEGTPILHRKETFLSPSDPRAPALRRVTESLERLGLFDDTRRIGRRGTWESMMRAAGVRVADGRVVRTGGSRG